MLPVVGFPPDVLRSDPGSGSILHFPPRVDVSDRRKKPKKATSRPTELRIIGGRHRGRKLVYHGDLRTRPMKDRIREAIFNLVGPSIAGTHAIDPFAGTGALGLEAISRGSVRATMVEQHFPTAEVIQQNISGLGMDDVADVTTADAFFWVRKLPTLGSEPWLVFLSPPYAFWVDRTEDMMTLLGALLEAAPAESTFIAESDEHFDFAQMPHAEQWDVRRYSQAMVGMLRTVGP